MTRSPTWRAFTTSSSPKKSEAFRALTSLEMSEENCTVVWGQLRDYMKIVTNESIIIWQVWITHDACGLSIGYATANRQLFEPCLVVEIVEEIGRELGQSVHIFIESKITSASV